MKKKKISADISPKAKQLLDGLCVKHERSKGFLIEKMIMKFCSGETTATDANNATAEKRPAKRFVPPKFADVDEYMRGKMCPDPITQAEKFCDFYESNGWKVGKNKMKCWKAAVRNWLKGNNNETTKGASKKLSAHERVKQRNDAKYRQPDECGLGMGANDGHMGRAMDEGERGATIEHMDNGAFIDYE